MHETGHSKPVHWDNPEGWDGMGMLGHVYTVADSCQCMAKTITIL